MNGYVPLGGDAEPSAPLSGPHLFVDESERGSLYHMVAVACAPADLDRARKELRAVLRPGMRRLHMAKEKEPLRREVLDTLMRTDMRARLYSCRAKPTRARPVCLRAIVADAVHARAARLVLEDHASARTDRRLIQRLLSENQQGDLRYEHLSGYEDPLLWAADALVWAAGRDSRWHPSVGTLIASRQLVTVDTA